MASLSNARVTHPPRSNPPLRSSSGPPSPCITPSTVTIVVVVSFMIALPLSLGAPSGAASHPCYAHLCPDPAPPSGSASHPCYEHLCPDPTPPPGFLSRTFWHAGCRPDARPSLVPRH